jgi:hypothetical protein
MTKIFGLLTAALLAGVLAIPANAAQFGGGGGGGAPARSGGGGGHSFGGGGGGHSFGRTGGGGGRAFSSHAGRSSHFATAHRGTSFGRAAGRTQRQHNFTQSNTSNRTLRNAAVNNHALRHNGNARFAPQTTRQGRFASRFGARGFAHGANFAAHNAWRHGWRAGFVGWYGPVFWPYAYSDIFDYAFWPGGYDDGYWANAYDGFFDGMFWGESGPQDAYAYAPAAAHSSRTSRANYAGVQELCKQPGSGITAWPFADIERKVGLNDEQKALLGDVRKAADDAAATFKASCPAENTFPLTPPGRLTAMTARLQGTLDAVKIVRPPLETFYASLSDEQKERFNALGPKSATNKQAANNAETTGAMPQDAKSCTEAKPGLANLPIEKIADVVKPTAAQQDTLKQLQDATAKAVSVLQAACPEDVPITPPGRLAAMETRLQAMVDAANTVKPALEGFYASLTNEQKARFDRISQQLAQSNG